MQLTFSTTYLWYAIYLSLFCSFMKNVLSNQESLFSSNKTNQIVRKYNQLFSTFWHLLRNRFWLEKNEVIVNVQRWLANDDNQIFWDYFWVTHSIMWELSHVSWGIDMESAHRCVRFVFSSGKTITISTNSLPDNVPAWITSLDSFYSWLEDFERKIFDEILLWINEIESEYFQTKSYRSTIQWIRTLSKNEISKILNVEEYPSN